MRYKPGQCSFKELYEYKSVIKLLKKLESDASGSENTEKVYLRCLHEYTKWCNINPDNLISERRNKGGKRIAEEKLLDYKVYLKTQRKLSPNSCRINVNAVKSFYNASKLPLEIKAPQARRKKSFYHVNLDEIRKMIQNVTLRDKVVILFLAQSGMSIDTLCRLKYSDIKQDWEANICPLHMQIIREKSGVWYDTFIARDTIDVLRTYFESRKKGTKIFHGNILPEKFDDNTPVVIIEKSPIPKPISRNVGWRIVSEAGKK